MRMLLKCFYSYYIVEYCFKLDRSTIYLAFVHRRRSTHEWLVGWSSWQSSLYERIMALLLAWRMDAAIYPFYTLLASPWPHLLLLFFPPRYWHKYYLVAMICIVHWSVHNCDAFSNYLPLILFLFRWLRYSFSSCTAFLIGLPLSKMNILRICKSCFINNMRLETRMCWTIDRLKVKSLNDIALPGIRKVQSPFAIVIVCVWKILISLQVKKQ